MHGRYRALGVGAVVSALALLAGTLLFAKARDASPDRDRVRLAAGTGQSRLCSVPQGREPVKLRSAELTAEIDNPYFPARPGARWVYRVTDPSGLRQRAVVTVPDSTRVVANGVSARVVYTTVFEQGERAEDNHAWYAQDACGNVWHLGEADREFEGGRVSTSKGSWRPVSTARSRV